MYTVQRTFFLESEFFILHNTVEFVLKKTMFTNFTGVHGVSNKLVKKEKSPMSVCSICGEKKKEKTMLPNRRRWNQLIRYIIHFLFIRLRVSLC
jgi:hypothetical protein